MKLSQAEFALVGLLIVYVAFFTHPVPAFILQFFGSPVGHAIALGGILYVTVFQSLIVGVFLAIAYVMTNSQVTEYMENPEKSSTQPKSAGVPPPAVHGAIGASLKKGDRIAQHGEKKGTHLPKPVETTVPKAKQPEKFQNFMEF